MWGSVANATRRIIPHRDRTYLCGGCTVISGNNIGAEGAAALAPQLQHLTQLEQLGLAGE